MTTTPTPDPPPPRFEVIVPEAMSAGVYSNVHTSWFNMTDFTIDFGVHLPTELGQDADGPFVHVPIQVVSRIKIPPSLVFD